MKTRTKIWRRLIANGLRGVCETIFLGALIILIMAVFLGVPFAAGYFISKLFISGTVDGTAIGRLINSGTDINLSIGGICSLSALFIFGIVLAIVGGIKKYKEAYEREERNLSM